MLLGARCRPPRQGCIRLGSRPRSAGFQRAVSQVSQPAPPNQGTRPRAFRAGWLARKIGRAGLPGALVYLWGMKHSVVACAILVGAILWPLSARAATPLVNHGDSWRYHKGTNAPQASWKTLAEASLDATWAAGNGGLGYSDNSAETAGCQTLLSDMLNKYSTIFIRKTFTVASAPPTNLHLFLAVDFDDGYIAWLDGAYLTNRFVSGAPAEPAFGALASGSHESSLGNSTKQPAETNDLGLASAMLGAGAHTLAIVGLNQTLNSSDFILLADLYLDIGATNPPVSGNTLSGTVSADTTLWASNSPYAVVGALTVASGATLTVQPGVTLQFNAGISLTVANGGRLLAEGNASNHIVFTRAGSSGYWGNVIINGAPGSPETRLAYADFAFNANSTGTPCLQVTAGTLACEHVAFANTGAPYMHLDGASFVVNDCVFPAGTPGVYFELVHGTGGIKTGGRGIFCRNFFGTANSVSGNYNDVLDFTGGNRPNQPIIQFYNNVFVGATDDELDLDGTDAWIEGNIFLHAHKNGSPDSASGVSGGDDTGSTSEITMLGNIFYDCDQAALAKQGNFYTLINNTIVHQTRVGGVDTDSGVVIVADAGTTEGAGVYLEGNIIFDAEKLVRNQVAALVTFTNNLMQLAWSGPGGGNSTNIPLFKHLPLLSETASFTNWAQAQIMKDWLSLLPGSPGLGAGPNGRDQGGVIPKGVSLSGEPPALTRLTNATLVVGINRTGSGIPVAGWPNGSGFTHFKWRLDGGAWSAETPIATPITLTALADGPHWVEATGKNDAGTYQDDPLLGLDALTTLSRTWTVLADTDGDGIPNAWELAHNLDPNLNDAGADPDLDGMTNLQEYRAGTDPRDPGSFLRIDAHSAPAQGVLLTFAAVSNKTYTVESRDTVTGPGWSNALSVAAAPTNRVVQWTDPAAPRPSQRFYRLRTPAAP